MNKSILTNITFDLLNTHASSKLGIQDIVVKNDYIGIQIQDEFFMIMVLDTNDVETFKKFLKLMKDTTFKTKGRAPAGDGSQQGRGRRKEMVS